jgi:hypothetical protein
MHFKNPEVLYFLFLLVIPILVHLFQLQKFKKVPFTNVAFLSKIVQQSRKSSQLKKWLILATRLTLFSAIVFAFSQPYFGKEKNTKNKQNFIYLDNSLSMNSKGEKGILLQNAIKDILENANQNNKYSLQTNTNFYENISFEELKKVLISTSYSTKKLPIETVLLKSNNIKKEKTNTSYNVFLISDFQDTYTNKFTNVNNTINLIQLKNSNKSNISIDSVYTKNKSTTNTSINVVVNNQGNAKENLPIAIYNNDVLKSKQVFSIEKNETKTIEFQLENSGDFKGKAHITCSDTFTFDNSLFFNISKPKKTAILSIGIRSEYFQKIYTNNEFLLKETSLEKLDYNNIQKQQFIILNELETIPESLQNSLLNFTKNGGEFALIPNTRFNKKSYNTFLNKLGFGKIQNQEVDSLQITDINFNHPLFANVFSKRVSNFQYPFIKNTIHASTKKGSTILSLENKKPFVSLSKINNGKAYLFAGSLQKNNSNFTNSPLIVPVFYNMAKLSFKQSKLFYRTNKENSIDVDINLEKDRVLQLKNEDISFIPQQRTYQNKVTLTTNCIENVGFYDIKNKDSIISTIAFNQPKTESSLSFLDSKSLADNKNIIISDSVANGFSSAYTKNEVQWLWKWFLALAIVSLLLEILILKFFKP